MSKVNKTFLKRTNGQIITFDATVRRSETNSATLSKYPVEDGFKISDHVSTENLKLSVEGTISSANNNVLNRAGFGEISDPAKARADLKEIFSNKEELIFITPEITYSGVYITSLVFTRESPTKGVITFTIRLEKPRKVVSKTSVVPAEDVSAEVQKAVELKNSEGSVITEQVETKSALSDILENFAQHSVAKGG